MGQLIIKLSLVIVLLAIVLYPIAKVILQDWWILRNYEASIDNTSGKKVLITGSSKGIGEELAYTYSKLGAHVYLTSRSADKLKEVAEKCKNLGAASAQWSTIDFSQVGSAKNVVQKAAAAMNGLDILILNHIHPYTFEPTASALKRLSQSIQVNLYSYLEGALTARPILEKSSGFIVFVSTIGSKMSIPYCNDYCMEKQALNAFAYTFRQELIKDGSTVSAGVAIVGLTDTEAAHKTLDPIFAPNIPLEYISTKDIAKGITALPVARVKELAIPWNLRQLLFMHIFMESSIDEAWRDAMIHLK